MAKQSGDKNVSVVGSYNNISVANNTTHNHYNVPEKKTPRTVIVGEYDKDIHITEVQKIKLQELVRDVAELDMIIHKGKSPSECYSHIWFGLNKHCSASSYKLIEQSNYDKAVKYLKKQKTIRRKDIKYKNAAKFKELTIPAIQARWSELGKNSEELYDFASQKLGKTVSSLEKLSVDNLDTLYTRVFSLKK